MTKAEFLKEHRAEWLKVSRKPMFTDLLAMIDQESPAKTVPPNDGDRIHGASVFLNEIYGWERLRKLLIELSAEPSVEVPTPDKFSESEI